MSRIATARERYAIGDWILDVDTATLDRGKGPVRLPGLTFELLVCLARHAPAVVSGERLLNEVWGDANVGEETLKQRVRLLRKALGDNGRAPVFIETVRGRGYQLLPKVCRVDEAKAVPLSRHNVRNQGKRLLLGLAVAGILMLGVLSLYFWPTEPKTAELSNQTSAQELFQRGRVYYGRYLAKDNEVAISLLKRAVAADPQNADAFALLSKAYSQQPKLGNGYWGEQARQAAEKAIGLAGDKADGFVALGVFFDVAGKPVEGIEAYKKALALESNHGDAWSNGAYDLMVLGRLAEAAEWNAKGLLLNPNGHFGKIQMGEILRLLGMTRQARAWFEKSVALQPDNIFALTALSKLYMLDGNRDEALALLNGGFSDSASRTMAAYSAGLIHYFSGDLETSVTYFKQAWPEGPAQAGSRLAIALRMLGNADVDPLFSQTETGIAKIVASGVRDPTNEVALAAMAAVDSRPDEAATWLATACDRGFSDLVWLEKDPAFRSLRERADFRGLVEALEAKLDRMRQRVEALALGL